MPQEVTDAARKAEMYAERIGKLRELQEAVDTCNREAEKIKTSEQINSDNRRRCGEVLAWLGQTPETLERLISVLGPRVMEAIQEQQCEETAEFNAMVASHMTESDPARSPSRSQSRFKEFGLTQVALDDARGELDLRTSRINELTLENENQCSEMEKLRLRISEMTVEVEHGQSRIRQLQATITKQNLEKATAEVELEERERNNQLVFDLRSQIETERSAWRREKGELDSQKQAAMLELSKALSAEQCALSQLDQVQRENGQLSDDLSGARADAGAAANVVEECRSQVADLEAKVRRQRLRGRKRRLRTQRLKRDVGCLRDWQGELQGQVNAAVALIRLVFIGTKSHVWKRVIGRIIRGPPIEVPGMGRSWDVWRILPPYSMQEGFCLLPGEYGIHGLGLGLVTSLDTEGLESHLPSLLGRLCAFQGILGEEDIECLGCMVDMLLEAFEETMEDARLHILHRLVMYQVTLLLGSRWARGEAVQRITRTLIRVDERAYTVVMMLTDWLEDGIQALLGRHDQRLSLVFYEAHDLLLVGFREHAGGILAIEMHSHTLRWIGFECIRRDPYQLTISFDGEEKRLMLDSVSRLVWVRQSLPSVENMV